MHERHEWASQRRGFAATQSALAPDRPHLGPDPIQWRLFDLYKALLPLREDLPLMSRHELTMLNREAVEVVVATAHELARRPEGTQ